MSQPSGSEDPGTVLAAHLLEVCGNIVVSFCGEGEIEYEIRILRAYASISGMSVCFIQLELARS
jgi:hypothetical protein